MTGQHLITLWSGAHLNLNCCKRVLSQVRSPRRHVPLLPAMPVHIPAALIRTALLSSFQCTSLMSTEPERQYSSMRACNFYIRYPEMHGRSCSSRKGSNTSEVCFVVDDQAGHWYGARIGSGLIRRLRACEFGAAGHLSCPLAHACLAPEHTDPYLMAKTQSHLSNFWQSEHLPAVAKQSAKYAMQETVASA